jgi:uncharacterized protein (TIGR03382 family)
MKNVLGLIAVAGIAAAANAQSGSLTWQVSTDGGATWSNAAVMNGAGAVQVRGTFAWSGIANSLGFGGSQFDALIIGGTAGDSVSGINRPSPFNFAAQTLVASAYAGGIKIDTAADVAAPGAGTGWVNPGQGSVDGIGTNFNSANPATVFTYTLNFDGTGSRTIGNVFNQTTGRALSVYTSNAGAQTRLNAPQVAINTASITLIPTPGTLALAGLGGLAAARRRR